MNLIIFPFTATIRIGFKFEQYNFFEPKLIPVTFRNVTIIRENNRLSEQTFGVQITFGDPDSELSAATLQQIGQNSGYDYVLDVPGNDHLNLSFYPNQSEISVAFSLQPDNVVEGIEGFRAQISSQGNPYPHFALPLENAFSSTVIRISEGKILLHLL